TLCTRYAADCIDLRRWGPRIRMGCRFGRFTQFSRELDASLDALLATGPQVVFCGSGDFHHVTLPLLRRLSEPGNLLVLDNHPDWMRGVPFAHCGTWLRHALRLPHVRQIFHVGGDADFDNRFRWLAPWSVLRAGRITVLPAVRYFQKGGWHALAHEPVRPSPEVYATPRRPAGPLQAFGPELRRYPLYITIDKDVLLASEATVNWDSGHLTLGEVEDILHAFCRGAGGRIAGADIVGDWSPVHTRGWLRRLLHWTEHPALDVNPDDADRCNEQTNLSLLETLADYLPAADFSARPALAAA